MGRSWRGGLGGVLVLLMLMYSIPSDLRSRQPFLVGFHGGSDAVRKI